uniref:Uncharacterized protein n=1 Tax=Ditylenchus dipsaci TaxID=166011 RepID=A0A915EPR7_9BILA
MLCLKEDRKVHPLRKNHPRPSRSLGALSAVIQRCGLFLAELHLQGIGQTLDLVVTSVCNEKYNHMVKQIIWKANKLECLRIEDVSQLFDIDKQGQPIPIITPNLKYLQVAPTYVLQEPLDEIKYDLLLKHCSSLQLLFLNKRCIHESENITNNHSLTQQLLRLQLPTATNYHSVKALKLGAFTDQETLQLVAKKMPQLEHLELHMKNTHMNDLELLYPLKQLSSLRLVIINEGDGNQHFDLDDSEDCLLNILSHLNETNPLRNLEFASELEFSVANVMQFLRVFTRLETFYCAMDYIPDKRYDLFCNQLADVLLELDSDNNCELQKRQSRKFRFQVQYSGKSDLVFKCERYGKVSYYLTENDYWGTVWRIRSVVLREILEKAFGKRTLRCLTHQEEDNMSLFM